MDALEIIAGPLRFTKAEDGSIVVQQRNAAYDGPWGTLPDPQPWLALATLTAEEWAGVVATLAEP